MGFEDAVARFAADVVARRFPGLPEALKKNAAAEIAKTLAEDPGFKKRFERVLAGAQDAP
jgi:hypothetical protein